MRYLRIGLGSLALSLWIAAASCAAGKSDESSGDCPIGGETCACTNGGSCDPGLVCLSGLCVNPTPSGSGGGSATTGTTTSSAADTTATGAGGDTSLGGGGPVGAGGGTPCESGCQAVDVLFALDGSGSMTAHINALAASQSFTQTIDALASINCGNIAYRIGMTDDNDGGFRTPVGWAGDKPWFDSKTMTKEQIVTAFNGAALAVAAGSGTGIGCEHVLTSSRDLLAHDSTGFIRPDAMLVLVLVTDVDDYGAYDQANGNECGLGCETPPTPLQDLYQSFLDLKGSDPKGLATILVAGDPSVNGGQNFCGQPGSCCGGIDCKVFHADRLWSFAGMMTGSNGYTANLCTGPQAVPNAVHTAFTSNIDLACKSFEPPG